MEKDMEAVEKDMHERYRKQQAAETAEAENR
jgi:hypothetical protein